MRRIGIFVFYDVMGEVDDYVEFLLGSIIKDLQKLIIIVNGDIRNAAYRKLLKYSQEIYVRENYGYDAGAYKDAFTRFLIDENYEQWDEIILFNDTFYGPIYPWSETFEKMNRENIDFWGLSRHPGGGQLPDGKEIPEHIQGYFLGCKKALFLSPDWTEFWKRLEYPKTYQEAVENFEIYFTQYFSKKGYRNSTLTDDECLELTYGENPTMWRFDELIQKVRFPVIKRRVFCLIHLNEVKQTIDYIEKNTDYDISLISLHLGRLCKESRIQPLAPFNLIELDLFCHRHKRVFIYGYGIYGKAVAIYLEYKGIKYDGIIVSNNEEKDIKLLVYDELDFEEGDGIILALGKQAFSEVYPIVRNKLSDTQLYYP